MKRTLRYYAAACQLDMPNPKTRDEIPARVKRMLDMVEFAVTGYEPPMTILLVPTWTEEDYAREAEAALDRTVVEALGEDPDVSVERRLVQRRPAHALTAHARDSPARRRASPAAGPAAAA